MRDFWSTSTSEVSSTFMLITEHLMDMTNAKILEVEPWWFERGVKEAIKIWVTEPTINRDGGSSNLPAEWNNMLKS